MTRPIPRTSRRPMEKRGIKSGGGALKALPDLKKPVSKDAGFSFNGNEGAAGGREMENLTSEKCTACRPDAPKVTLAEIQELKPQIPNWKLLDKDGVPMLERAFPFKEYAQTLAFAMKVGELAEQEGHHPALLIEWGKVTVSWWTHKIRGLHRNDFISAAKTDGIYKRMV